MGENAAREQRSQQHLLDIANKESEKEESCIPIPRNSYHRSRQKESFHFMLEKPNVWI
jgi:hypothetical protein